jgi:mRNA-degrading endonuclease YafQ of YafQ-DinJ toxin-antitoxin module
MWRIEEHQRVEKQLDTVPQDILKRYEKWKDIAMLSGLPGLRRIKGFHDEALRGEWRGYRSSRLGLQYRVIYRLLPKQSLFQVEHLSPHDYRRR